MNLVELFLSVIVLFLPTLLALLALCISTREENDDDKTL